MQIRRIEKVSRAWHRLAHRDSDSTEAMNVPDGVLIRSTVKDTEWVTEDIPTSAMSSSTVHVDGLVVAQRWAVELIQGDEDEGTEPFIGLAREVFLTTIGKLNDERDKPMVLTRGNGYVFRMFNADDDMPRPPDEIVRSIAENRRPPTEVEALRAELDDAQRELSAIRFVISDFDPLANPAVLSDRLHDLLAAGRPHAGQLLQLREDVQRWKSSFETNDELRRLFAGIDDRIAAIMDTAAQSDTGPLIAAAGAMLERLAQLATDMVVLDAAELGTTLEQVDQICDQAKALAAGCLAAARGQTPVAEPSKGWF